MTQIISRLNATSLVIGSPSSPTKRSLHASIPVVLPPYDQDHQKYPPTEIDIINRVSQAGASPCESHEAMSAEINASAVTISPS